MEHEDFVYWYTQIRQICVYVILPIFVSVGLLVNVVALCVWVFGPKSKSMCCAIYFAANSAVDFLLLTAPLVWTQSWYKIITPTDFTCKLFVSFYSSCKQLTTFISAIITVERSLTILFPLFFQTKDMRKRSKIILIVIVIFQPLIQSMRLYYEKMVRVKSIDSCVFSNNMIFKVFIVFENCVTFLIPFAVIVTFNTATVSTLIKQRFGRDAVFGRQDHVNIFTKLTLLTGMSFVLAYTPWTVLIIHKPFDLGLSKFIMAILAEPFYVMLFFNSVMNPIICIIFCKSVRDDITYFIKAIARRTRWCCTCGRSHSEVSTSNITLDTTAVETTEITS